MQENNEMLNFTVGPVMSDDAVRAVGAEQVPYFRTPEFSQIVFENEALVKKFALADDAARVIFLTGSGTAAMEAVIMNCFTPDDKLLIVNGGSFGQRFVDLCRLHQIPFTELVPEFGYDINAAMLSPYEQQGYTGFLVNVNETSTGVHYDINLISNFCKRNGLFLVVDAISSFLADPFNMKALGADVMITGSQKALACPPGISMITLSPRGVDRVNSHCAGCMYFDLKDALKNAERGQTPFTPAVGIIRQINRRLHEIDEAGGIESEIKRIKALADDFRCRVKALPFSFVSHAPGNAVTPLHPQRVSAYDIFTTLKDEYNIWICPNGGAMRDRVFRVGHIGALTVDHNTQLINAMNDMLKRGLL